MEFKGDLDNLRITYARMQAQLEETHKLLHQEHKRRYRLEVQPRIARLCNIHLHFHAAVAHWRCMGWSTSDEGASVEVSDRPDCVNIHMILRLSDIECVEVLEPS